MGVKKMTLKSNGQAETFHNGDTGDRWFDLRLGGSSAKVPCRRRSRNNAVKATCASDSGVATPF